MQSVIISSCQKWDNSNCCLTQMNQNESSSKDTGAWIMKANGSSWKTTFYTFFFTVAKPHISIQFTFLKLHTAQQCQCGLNWGSPHIASTQNVANDQIFEICVFSLSEPPPKLCVFTLCTRLHTIELGNVTSSHSAQRWLMGTDAILWCHHRTGVKLADADQG